MAGIVWWTPPRREVLRKLIEDEGLTYAEAARRMTKRYRRPVTARACRNIGQKMRLAAKVGRPPESPESP